MSKLSFDQLTDLFLLLSVEGIGPGKLRTLLAKFRSTKNIINADYQSLMSVEGIRTNLAKRIRKITAKREKIEKKNIITIRKSY